MNDIDISNKLVKHLDKILFVLACFYLVIVSLWFVNKTQFSSSLSNQKHNPNHQISESDAEFIAYMLDAIKNIAHQQQALSENRVNTPLPASKNTSNIPSYQLQKTLLSKPLYSPPIPIPQPQTTIIEKIYIPISPKTQPQSIVTNTNSESSLYPSLPPPPPITTASNSEVILPPVERLTSVPVLSPNNLSNQSFSQPLNQSSNQSLSSLPEVNQSLSYELVGILESGDKSVALFNTNGMTHRIHLGEEIGTSGWFLLSISNQQAVIRRHHQIHHMNVGDLF